MFEAVSGELYSVAVDGFDTETGDFFVGVFQPETPPPAPPAPPPPPTRPPVTPPPPPPPPPPAADTTPPSLDILGRRLRMTRAGSVRLRLRCQDLSPTCEGAVRVRTAQRLRIRGARRFVRLGRESLELDSGRTAVVRIDFSRRARRLVVRRGKLRVRISVAVRDAAGNLTTATRTVRLTAPSR